MNSRENNRNFWPLAGWVHILRMPAYSPDSLQPVFASGNLPLSWAKNDRPDLDVLGRAITLGWVDLDRAVGASLHDMAACYPSCSLAPRHHGSVLPQKCLTLPKRFTSERLPLRGVHYITFRPLDGKHWAKHSNSIPDSANPPPQLRLGFSYECGKFVGLSFRLDS